MSTVYSAFWCAAALHESGELERAVSERYAGWNGELGQSIEAGASLEALAERVHAQGISPRQRSGRQERLENPVNRYVRDARVPKSCCVCPGPECLAGTGPRRRPIELVEERSGLELTNAIGAYPLDIDADGNAPRPTTCVVRHPACRPDGLRQPQSPFRAFVRGLSLPWGEKHLGRPGACFS